jgi:hypothetical protein
LIAALGSLSLALTVFGAAGGPVAIAILGISTLVGWLIQLKLKAADALPSTLEQTKNSLFETKKYIDDLEKYLENLGRPSKESFAAGLMPGGLGGASVEAQRRLAEAKKKYAELYESYQKQMAAMSGEGKVSPAKDPVTQTLTAREEKLKRWYDLITGETTKRVEKTLDELGMSQLQPLPDNRTLEEQLGAAGDLMGDYLDTVKETNEEISASYADMYARNQEMMDEYASAQAQMGITTATMWSDLFMQMVWDSQNFQNALGKTIVVGLIRTLKTVVQAYMAEIMAMKIKEVGKALMGAPMSFGATLGAIGPIVAASAVALAGLGAIEAHFMKQNSGFEQGGVIPRTGHFLMHEGEVVYNPRKNSIADLVGNLRDAGATEALQAMVGGGGPGGGISVNFYGDIRSQEDVVEGMNRVRRQWQRGMRTGV